MARWGGVEERELDNRNQQRAYSLASKVTKLKSIAVDLEQESYEHNRLLNDIDNDFGSGDSLLTNSMGRLRGVLGAGQKNRTVMCYVCLLVIFFFILTYYITSKSSAPT